MKRKKLRSGQIILGAVLGAYALFCLMPILLVIIVSFSSDESIRLKGYSYFPTEFSLKAYQYVGSFGMQLVTSYGVTIWITVSGTVIGLVFMSMFAYALSRNDFQMRKYFAIYLLIPMLFSGGQLSSYMVNTTVFHLKDSLLVLILPMAVSTMNVIILRTYIQGNVPSSLIESAKIDGAGELRTFWQIVFPIMKPALASVGFMLAVSYWNDWQNAFLYIQSPNKTPLQLLLIRIEKNLDFILQATGQVGANLYDLSKNMPQESGRMAILITVCGPIMVAYPFFQKYFVKGITMGSVKG